MDCLIPKLPRCHARDLNAKAHFIHGNAHDRAVLEVRRLDDLASVMDQNINGQILVVPLVDARRRLRVARLTEFARRAPMQAQCSQSRINNAQYCFGILLTQDHHAAGGWKTFQDDMAAPAVLTDHLTQVTCMQPHDHFVNSLEIGGGLVS
jgi:hypothetical protein